VGSYVAVKVSLANAAYPEIRRGTLVLVPVGSLEQHGPHLPLDTDTAIAAAVTSRVADLIGGDVLVAPPLVYAASGEHQSFPGTSSIGSEALHQLLVELVRSMRTWCGRVVFVNAHGGNMTALGRAIAQLLAEGHDVAWAPCKTKEVDAHAGVTETSLMLHLRPSDVRMELAEAGNTAPISELLPDLMAGGIAAVSANGVLGDPVGASAEQGARLLEAMSRQVAGWIRGAGTDERGMLRGGPPDE